MTVGAGDGRGTLRGGSGRLPLRSGPYFANAARIADDVALLTRSGPTLTWFCLDGAAIGDVDYSAAAVLTRVQTRSRAAGVRMVLANINESVGAQLERYGLTV